ncbi:helix-turn-helix domain-containing protein [Clostridium perfringens]|uniref:helix-turn-helix domain-containing protein n=1 Tax=Clostridium perfringens TaxID=1502 RepID=UPI0024BC4524|nr:helix-turn-helix transcriptional regulator [Clostridium perfringens]
MNLEKLAKIIKKYRKDNNLTQQQLADKLDISRSVLSYYENNNAEPNIYFLYNFSRLINCTIDELVDSAGIFDDFSLSSTPQNNFEPIKKVKPKIKEVPLSINDGQLFLKETKNMLGKIKKTYDELNYSKLKIDKTLTELDKAINRANRTKDDLSLSLRRVNRLYDDLKRTSNREERFDKLVKQLDDISKNFNSKFENDIIKTIDIEISTDITPYINDLRKNKILEFKNNAKDNENKYTHIPILGVVAAGNPSYACENILDNIYLPK